MHESVWGDIVWLWGATWPRHALFVFAVLVLVGAFRHGWVEADNAQRINRRLRNEDRA